jgi:hypothetical protein
MSVEYWWKNTGTGNTKYSEKNRSQSRFVHHKSHVEGTRVEPGSPR